MIDTVREHLTKLNENYVEKNAVFKVKVIPFFCSVRIKKDIKQEDVLSFYSNQLLKVCLTILFLLFGLAIYDIDKGLNHGPIQLGFSALIFINLIITQIAIESLKSRLFSCNLMTFNKNIK